MSNLVKADEIKFNDDLKQPTLGRVIGDETALMLAWGALAIGSILYIPPFGFISALGLAYLGYKDIQATTGKSKPSSGEASDSSGDTQQAKAQSTLLNAVDTPVRQLPSGPTHEGAPSVPEPQFENIPWGNGPAKKPSSDAYEGEVYASPEDKKAAMAEFMAPNIDDLLKMPIRQRAEEMLRALKLAGCNLRPYIHDRVLIATGTQRSGKSTIVVLIGILEAALLGKELRYITSDGDIYPVAFSGLGNGSKYYGLATQEIEATQLGQASNIVWIFDEVTKQDSSVKEGLWEQLLTGFVKSGASARLITHGTTMKAIGFPTGMADQVKTEAVIVKALRKSDSVGREKAATLPGGGQHPSGEYRRQELLKDGLQDVKAESLQLPEWLLFDKNEQGNPCYVRSLLKYFPELDSRALGATPPQLYPEKQPVDVYATQRESLEAALSVETVSHPVTAEVVTDDQALNANAAQFAQLVLTHIESKGGSSVTLARLLADNYQAKQAFKCNSTASDIREKGKETAKQLAIRCRTMGLLLVTIKGDSVTMTRPEAPLFGGGK